MIEKRKWTRTPRVFVLNEDRIEITTEPHTDLWQRTYTLGNRLDYCRSV